ncbi:ParB N-terminal domain-containing protein [Enterococcus pseudoavium]|uniref:ParB N-terminal domain-containing protein n=1 Tax=Enterococcus pseudoavium TaxID=44007 RepID=A0ABU3FLE4_9ENTE|nr:ParB N-terminal domain-containing protein [Enterococcus pseudoavium]
MKMQMMATSDLIPYVNNPRQNDDAVDAVASSIKNFGFKVPIVVDGGNEIVNGHTRLKAAKKLGIDEVPVIVADDLTPEQIKAFRLADNKVGEIASWDENALAVELEELENLDFDMSEFGFEELIEDTFSDEFELPDGDKPNATQITFTLSNEQAEIIKDVLSKYQAQNVETFGNTNTNGNKLFGVIKEWEEHLM